MHGKLLAQSTTRRSQINNVLSATPGSDARARGHHQRLLGNRRVGHRRSIHTGLSCGRLSTAQHTPIAHSTLHSGAQAPKPSAAHVCAGPGGREKHALRLCVRIARAHHVRAAHASQRDASGRREDGARRLGVPSAEKKRGRAIARAFAQVLPCSGVAVGGRCRAREKEGCCARAGPSWGPNRAGLQHAAVFGADVALVRRSRRATYLDSRISRQLCWQRTTLLHKVTAGTPEDHRRRGDFIPLGLPT